MTLIYRDQKGAPLTIEELDGNFKDLNHRLETLESHSFEGGGISHMTLEGDELVILDAHHLELGRVQLPMPQFSGKGAWQKKHPYAVYDLIRHEHGVYFCLKAHESTTFEQDHSYWQLLWQSPQSDAVLSKLPLFIPSDLPRPEPGMMGLLIAEDKVLPIYADGKVWRRFSDYEAIEG